MDSSRKIPHKAHSTQTTSPTSGNQPPPDSGKTAAPRVRARSRPDAPSLCVQRPLTQEVLYKTLPAYSAMCKTEQHLITVHHYLKPMIDADVKLSKDLKTYKKGQRGTPEEARADEKYEKAVTSLAQLAHKKSKSPLDVADFLDEESAFASKIYPLTGGIRDTRTGLYAQLVPDTFNSSEYFLCFPGTGAMNNLDKQWSTNIDNFLSDKVPTSFEQAVQLTAEIQQAVIAKEAHLTLVGHSLGGGIANYVGLKLGIESVCFNPAGMGKACLADLDNDITPERVNQQTHLVIEDDLASDSKAMKLLLQMRGHTLPLVGKVYQIPTEHPEYPNDLDAADRHRMDGFSDLYMMARKEKAQLQIAIRNASKKAAPGDGATRQSLAPATTTTTTSSTNTTTTTTTTTVASTDTGTRTHQTLPPMEASEASEETVKERRRQAAREEKKPEAESTAQKSAYVSNDSRTEASRESLTSLQEGSSDND